MAATKMKALESIHTKEEYNALHNYALLHPQDFWLSQAEYLSWMSEPEAALEDIQEKSYSWFSGGMLNVCFNCVDRHVMTDPTKIAIIYDDGEEIKRMSFAQLQKEVCLASNMLLEAGLKADDTVTIYLESTPQLAIYMLACSRVGVKHNVVYNGFSPLSLARRIHLSKSTLLITQENITNLSVPLSQELSVCEEMCPTLETILWLGDKPNYNLPSCSHYYFEEHRASLPLVSTPIPRNSCDDLFLYFQSNHQGIPQAITHNCAGFLLYNTLTFKVLHQIEQGDVYWCGYDLSWFEGHAQGLYAPLANGVTIYMPSQKLQKSYQLLIERLNEVKVTHAYMKTYFLKDIYQKNILQQSTFPFLKRVILSGENIDPVTWATFKSGLKDSAVMKNAFVKPDFGGALLSTWYQDNASKPGSYGFPFPGIDLHIVDKNGIDLEPREEGHLKIKSPWPSIPQSFMLANTTEDNFILDSNNHSYKPTLLNRSSRDYDGDYWLDDDNEHEVNVHGNLVALKEVEHILEKHPAIKDSIVFATPNGQQSYDLAAFITFFNQDQYVSDDNFHDSVSNVKEFIHHEIGSIIDIKHIFICNDLPIDKNGSPMKGLIRKVINSIDGYSTMNDDVYSSADNTKRVRNLIEQYRNYEI